MEQDGQEFDSFEEIVQKVVNVETKAALKPRFSTRKTDQYCFSGSQPATANISTWGKLMKDPRVEEPKARFSKSKDLVLQRLKDEENPKKT